MYWENVIIILPKTPSDDYEFKEYLYFNDKNA